MRSARARDLAVVVGPALLAGGLCLIQIPGRSLGFDEAATVAIASQHGSSLWSAIAHDGGNMTGYYLLLHLMVVLFGHGELALRLPSAVGPSAASALTGLLALRLFDRRAAFAAGTLMAVSMPLVFWGQSARSYAIVVALSAGSFLAFTALLESPRPRGSWVAYVVCTALALYASLTAALLIAAQLTVLIWRPRERRRVATAIAGIAVCCVPLMVLATLRGTGQLFWVPRPDLTSVKQVAEALSSAGLQPTIRSTSTTYVLLGITIVLLITIVTRLRGWRLALVLSWLAVPVGIALVESFIGTAIFVPRNLLIVLPAVALLLAWGMTRIGAVGWAGLAALIALRALQLGPAYGVSPEDWRGATASVMRSVRAGDCIAFYPSDGRNAFRYYAHGQPPRSVLPAVPWTYDGAYIENYSTLARPPAGCERLWLLSNHVGQTSGPARSRVNLMRYRSLRAMLSASYGPPRTREFGYADPVTVELFERWRSTAVFRSPAP